MILASHGLIASQITQFVGLLDVYPSAAAAYSLRKLRTAYTGSAIEVRRTNLDVADIGFTSTGELDTAALLAFTGTGALDNGFVTKWYDQSGNGYNATQTTALRQPQIVSTGSVILENGKPSIQFDGTDVLAYNGLVYTTNTVFATAVVLDNNSANFSAIAIQATGTEVGRSAIIQIDNSTPRKSLYFFNNGTTYNNFSSTTIVNNTQTLLTNYSFDNDYYSAIDGGLGNNDITNQSFTPVSSSGFGIGGRANNLNFFTGKIQELNIWNSDQSSNKTGIETNINDFYSIY
jgi:hypothetical protein